MNSKNKTILIIKAVLLLLFLAAAVILTIKYSPFFTGYIKNPEKFGTLLRSYGNVSIAVFIGFQVAQVVIAAIPGEIVQITGGYVYGTVLGTVYSVAGIFIGSVIAFYIARLLGYSLIKVFISQEKLDKFNYLINNPKSEVIMFVLFLLPGVPKDMVTYIAGLTPIKPLVFFMLSIVGRFPALVVTSYIGANMQEGNYLTVLIVAVIACILCVAGLLTKDRIVVFLHKVLHKKNISDKT